MLHRFGVVFGVLGIAILLMAGCSGEKGAKGDPGTAECIQCHSDNTTIVAIDGQWRNSVHFTGGNFERNTPPCSGCHTSEGFVALLNTGDPGTPLNPSPVGCFACHEPHTNHNFNLRTTAPVALEMFNATYDKGLSNLCANCHHARALSPAIADTVRITSSRWGPHHGPQADILNGSGAYQFADVATYRNSPHRNLVTDGCPQCHMATPFGTQSGGHTMNMAYTFHGSAVDNVAGCNNDACHSGLTDFDLDGTQDSVEVYIEELDLGEKPRLLVFNKSDLLSQLKKSDPLTFMKVRQISRRLRAISISAADRKSLEPLIEELQRRFWPDEITPL